MICKNYKCRKCHKTYPAGEWNSITAEYASKSKGKGKFLCKIQHSGNRRSLSYVCPGCLEVSPSCDIVPVPEMVKSETTTIYKDVEVEE